MLLHLEALSRCSLLSGAFHSFLHVTRRTSFFLAFILILVSCCVSVCAQTESDTEAAEVVRIRTDLVTVPLFVTDHSGQRVPGLTADDFGAQVDGHNLKPQYFAAGTERVALCFALDTSGSARETIRQQSEAALALFSRFGPQSRVEVWHFGARPLLVADFTTSAESARPGFNLAAIADERTAIFDAAAAAVRSFERRDGDPAERRILILISDGLDTASRIKAQVVINEAQQRAVSIYVIHLPLFAPRDGRLQLRPAAKGFRSLAEATGGRYFIVGDVKAALNPRASVDLSPIFKAIEEDLRGQYVLGFYPEEASRDNRFHRLTISLSSRQHRNLRVRQLREGYTLRQ